MTQQLASKLSLVIKFLIGENTTVKGRKWNLIHQQWQVKGA
jgi:hypothetical protein